MSEEKKNNVKQAPRMTTAPVSQPREVLKGEQESPRMTNADDSEPREIIEYLTSVKREKKSE